MAEHLPAKQAINEWIAELQEDMKPPETHSYLREAAAELLRKQATDIPRLPTGKIEDGLQAAAIVTRLADCVVAYETLRTYGTEQASELEAIMNRLGNVYQKVVPKLAGLTPQFEHRVSVYKGLMTSRKALGVKLFWEGRPCTLAVRDEGRSGCWVIRRGHAVATRVEFPVLSIQTI